MRVIALCVGLAAAFVCTAAAARQNNPAFTPLYQFPGGGDGLAPWGGLTKVGGIFYGTTFYGGAYGRGCVFSINAAGNETIVYSFKAGADAQMPQSGLLKIGDLLYGISNIGGADGYGAVYSFNPATSVEAVVFSFTPAMGGGSGATPAASGNFLYGTTFGGGTGAGFGVVFKLNLKTNAETTLHAFSGGADGGSPQYGVTYAKGVLYGTTTLAGGSANAGTLFSVDATTGAEKTLFTFDGGAHGGAPYGGVIDVGGVLYGDADYGGSQYGGVIFSYTLATATEATLYNFSGGTDGGNPEGGLLDSGGTLYGTTFDGGGSGLGTVFSLDPASGVLTTLYSFSGGTNGGYSVTPLIDVNGVLYGTDLGPESSAPDNGTVFTINLKTGKETTLHDFRGASPFGAPNSALLKVGNTLFGTSGVEGADFAGTVYTLDPSTGAQNTVYAFTGGSDGGVPDGGLTAVGGTLFGVTWTGGVNQAGTIYAIDPATGAQSVVYDFPAPQSLPQGPLAVIKGVLYGTTDYGGASAAGSIFAFNPATKALTTIHDFTAAADGGLPLGGVIASGGVLYGAAEIGGSAYDGVIYQIDPATATQTVLYNFQGGTDGSYPQAPPIDVGGTLYGTTAYGGNLSGDCFGGAGCGVLYGLSLDGGAYAVLHAFDDTSDGAVPNAALTALGKTMYGSTQVGGAYAFGTLFSYVPASGILTTLYDFTGAADGANPAAALLPVGGLFYGSTGRGASANLGGLFSFTP